MSESHQSSTLDDMGYASHVVTDTDETLLRRIRGEFVEMPGLRLTGEQAARLWHLDSTRTTLLLQVLVETRFLAQTAEGWYLRSASL